MNIMANPRLHILFPVPSILKEQGSWDWDLALVRMGAKMASPTSFVLRIAFFLRSNFKTPFKTNKKLLWNRYFHFQFFKFSLQTNDELTQNVSTDTLSSIFNVISKIFCQMSEYLYKLPKGLSSFRFLNIKFSNALFSPLENWMCRERHLWSFLH